MPFRKKSRKADSKAPTSKTLKAPKLASPTQVALNAYQAANHLGVGRTFFYEVIRPQIQSVDMSRPGSDRPLIRWRRDHLDAYLAARTKAA
jgi:hypothetical protein